MFFLVMSVDVVMGPLLTFAVFNKVKGRIHLRCDLMVIGVLQTAALIYGLHTVYDVRPIVMALEVDRFRLITAADVNRLELSKAAPAYRELSLTGPQLIGTRAPQAGEERNDALFMGLKGIDIAQRPQFWQPYALSKSDALVRSRPISVLSSQYAAHATEIAVQLHEMAADPASARFLPVVARGDWVAVLDASGNVLGYMMFDGFFP